MNKIEVEIDTKKVKDLVIDYINTMFNGEISEKDVKIVVRSKQNYRNQEWENGDFKAIVSKYF